MATTILPPLNASADEKIAAVYDAFERAYGDYDKTTDVEDGVYYGGLIDAYYNVLVLFGAITPEPKTEDGS